MKISTALSSAALLACAVATPLVEVREAAMARRSARRENHAFHSETLDPNTFKKTAKGQYMTSSTRTYSGGPGGWAGAVQNGKTGVSQVIGTFVVPEPSIPPNGDASGKKYGGAAWVGIDGYGTGELWQTGVTWTISGAETGFSAWWEWVPGPYTSFSNITVSAGDTVTVEVVAQSSTSGTAYVTNESTGEQVSQFLSGQAALPQVAAEWIVEDFQSGSGPIPFADFSPAVTFSDCSYTASSGQFGVSGSIMLEVGQDQNTPFTSCSTSGSSSVTCSYVGNANNS